MLKRLLQISLQQKGLYDVVHLDMQIQPEHMTHAFSLLTLGDILRVIPLF